MTIAGSNQLEAILGLFGLSGHWEILIIVLAILLLFGGKKLPELARSLAKGLRGFKEEMKGVSNDIEKEEPPAEEKQDAEKTQQQDSTEKKEV